MPALAGRADVLIGARTGSGKTLAYLLPIMQTLRTDEERAGSRARPRRPRALVLLPTRELCTLRAPRACARRSRPPVAGLLLEVLALWTSVRGRTAQACCSTPS